LIVDRGFENEKFKLKKYFTVLKKRNYLQKLKKFF
jgi:hypothetical protein